MDPSSHSRRRFLQLASGTFAAPTVVRQSQPIFQVGLDVGCSKVAVIVVEHRPGARPQLLSATTVPSRSVTNFGIKDERAATRCVDHALKCAEISSGILIRDVSIAVAGSPLILSAGTTTADTLIRREGLPWDLDEFGLLKALSPQTDQVWPIFHGARQRIITLRRCLATLGVSIGRSMLAPAAAVAGAVDVRLLRGALVIDIGERTTGYALVVERKIIAMDCLPYGSDGIQKIDRFDTSLMTRALRSIRQRFEEQGVDITKLQDGIKLTGGGSLVDGILDEVDCRLNLTHWCRPITRLADSTGIIQPTLNIPTLSTALGLALQKGPPNRNHRDPSRSCPAEVIA